MTIRDDNRLADAPLRPLSCSECGAVVAVRKSSWEQTSVQWSEEAMRMCRQRRFTDSLVEREGAVFLACSSLRDSIENAVRGGRLRIVDETGGS